MKNKHAFATFYTAILITVTVWSLLDTFVIVDKVAAVDETQANTSIYVDLENEYSSTSNLNNALAGESDSSSKDLSDDNYNYPPMTIRNAH